MSQGIAKMQDIPLAVEEQNTMMSEAQNMSKTGTIKRFFKLPYKKSETAPDTKSEGDLQQSDSKDFEEPRRFHLRIGNKQKKLDAHSPDLDELPTSSAQNVTNKLTLKKSIYKYWQTVFKNVKSSTSINNTDGSNEAASSMSTDQNTGAQKQIAVVPEILEQNENNLEDATKALSLSDVITEADNKPKDETPNEEVLPIAT